MLLYSPPQAGYGTSCDASCSEGDGIAIYLRFLAV